MHTYVEALTEP